MSKCPCGATENYKGGAGHLTGCPEYENAPPHPTKEPLSSNLVADLRKPIGAAMIDGTHFKKGDPLHDTLRLQAATAIERLTARVAELEKDAEQHHEWVTPQLERLGREIEANDRLRAELERERQGWSASQQISELRAALVRVEAEIHLAITPAEMAQNMHHHAKTALRGADETSPTLRPTHTHQWLPIGDKCGPMVEYECPCGAAMYDPAWPHSGEQK